MYIGVIRGILGIIGLYNIIIGYILGLCSKFCVWGLGFRLWGFGLRICGLGFRAFQVRRVGYRGVESDFPGKLQRRTPQNGL